MKHTALALFLLVGCKTAPEPLTVTGEALQLAGAQFISTARLMQTGRDNGTVTPAQYAEFKLFGEKFQTAYPLAVQLWKSARAVNDAVLEGQVAAIISTLVDQLAQFYVLGVRAAEQLAAQAHPDGGS